MSDEARKKILVLSLSGIGNFIMQSPVFEAIKKEKLNWHITVWVAPRGTKVLAEANPYIDEVIEAKIKTSVLMHYKHAFYLARQKFDIGIVLSPGQLWKSAAYLWLAGIKTRIGNSYPWRGNKASGFLLTEAVPEKKGLHDIEQNLRLLEPLGIKATADSYKIVITETLQEKANKVIADLNLSPENKLVGFHMGSATDLLSKRWPADKFIEAGRKLIGGNTAILLFGGPDEEDLKREVKAGLGEKAVIIQEDLMTTIAVISKCESFLSNDSGLMHAAAAVGVNTYGLFGPTDESATGPRGMNSSVIRAEGAKPVYNTEKNFNLGKASHQSIEAITVNQVLENIR